jgi:hypothetical protein
MLFLVEPKDFKQLSRQAMGDFPSADWAYHLDELSERTASLESLSVLFAKLA